MHKNLTCTLTSHATFLKSQSDKTSNSVSNTTASKRRSSIIVQSTLESNDHHHRRRTSGMVMVKAAQEYERASRVVVLVCSM